MALTGLREPGLKLILFGGKGGVGKTTCASSAALYCAQQAKTLFVQEMLKRGFLASNIFYASLAHTDAHVRKYAKAVDEVFGIIAKARREGGVGKLLKGPVAHTGFQRLN